MPDRLPSLVLLVGFWVPPALLGWTAAEAALRRESPRRIATTTAVLAVLVVAWSAAWYAFQLDRIPPYLPGATHDPRYAPPEAVAALRLVAGVLVLPVSAIACALAFRLRARALRSAVGRGSP